MNKEITIELSDNDLKYFEKAGVISSNNGRGNVCENSNANFSRALSWLLNRDCAMITAWRFGKKRDENDANNRNLQLRLRKFGYGVSKVRGYYAEVGHSWKFENSFLVFDLLGDSKTFFNRLFGLSAEYEQDSFLYKKAGENEPAYEIGTNEDFGVSKRKLIGMLRIGNCESKSFTEIGTGRISFE